MITQRMLYVTNVHRQLQRTRLDEDSSKLILTIGLELFEGGLKGYRKELELRNS